MNKQKAALWLVVVALIGGTAAILVRLHHHPRLGIPGLKMVHEPVYDERGKVIGTETVALPRQVLDYESRPLPVTLEELGWLPADTTYARRGYEAPDQFKITLSVVLMGADSRSIHKPQICLPGQGWTIARSEVVTVTVSAPFTYALPVMKLTSGREFESPDGTRQKLSSLYVYWFVADHQVTAQHGQRMWWMAEELLRTGILQRWAYVSCFSICRPGQEAATFERMTQFIAEAVPRFQLATWAPLSASRQTVAAK
jgi:hypothetical protein